MPSQRLKEKRVEECVGREREREREREQACMHAGERESVGKCFGSSFYMFSLFYLTELTAVSKFGRDGETVVVLC